MSIPAVVSLVTLGVRDVAASTAFYRALGFELSSSSVESEVSFFRTAGGLLGLYGADDLRRDANAESAPPPGTFRGVTLAINVAAPEVVDASVAAAEQAGARIVKAAQATDWGGYHAYFADPDGHLWEVAHNPFWPLDANGCRSCPHSLTGSLTSRRPPGRGRSPPSWARLRHSTIARESPVSPIACRSGLSQCACLARARGLDLAPQPHKLGTGGAHEADPLEGRPHAGPGNRRGGGLLGARRRRTSRRLAPRTGRFARRSLPAAPAWMRSSCLR